jgi:hypothetical protein
MMHAACIFNVHAMHSCKCAHKLISTHAHAHARTRTRTRAYAHARAYAHTHTHTRIHTHTRTRTQVAHCITQRSHMQAQTCKRRSRVRVFVSVGMVGCLAHTHTRTCMVRVCFRLRGFLACFKHLCSTHTCTSLTTNNRTSGSRHPSLHLQMPPAPAEAGFGCVVWFVCLFRSDGFLALMRAIVHAHAQSINPNSCRLQGSCECPAPHTRTNLTTNQTLQAPGIQVFICSTCFLLLQRLVSVVKYGCPSTHASTQAIKLKGTHAGMQAIKHAGKQAKRRADKLLSNKALLC